MENLMLFPIEQREFDFNSIVKNNSYRILAGPKVNVDRIIYDVTGETVIGISGTMVIRGLKIRGMWDPLGNIMECKKMFRFTNPKSLVTNIDNIFNGVEKSILQLVCVKDIKEEQL